MTTAKTTVGLAEIRKKKTTTTTKKQNQNKRTTTITISKELCAGKSGMKGQINTENKRKQND